MDGSPLHKTFIIQTGFDADTCAKIINSCMKFPAEPGQINEGEDNLSIRRSTIRWVDQDEEITKMVNHYFHMANRCIFGFDIVRPFGIQFTEYHADDSGHYDWHDDTDSMNKNMYDRKLSLSMQLSDPSSYEGGILEFEGDGGSAPREQGHVTVFPALKKHRVTPVTKGVRYSLVSWMEGPRWR